MLLYHNKIINRNKSLHLIICSKKNVVSIEVAHSFFPSQLLPVVWIHTTWKGRGTTRRSFCWRGSFWTCSSSRKMAFWTWTWWPRNSTPPKDVSMMSQTSWRGSTSSKRYTRIMYSGCKYTKCVGLNIWWILKKKKKKSPLLCSNTNTLITWLSEGVQACHLSSFFTPSLPRWNVNIYLYRL